MGVANYQWAQSAGAGDFNNDGWPDLFVANDVTIDRVYMNKSGKGFEMRPDMLPGLFLRYGMNGDAADLNDDGWLDIYNTKLTKPGFTSARNQLWMNKGGHYFNNEAERRGVSRCGWGWAARFVDLSSRGRKDLFVVNGLVSGNEEKSYWFSSMSLGAMDSYFLQQAKFYPPMKDQDLSGHEKNCVFYNMDGQGFSDIADAIGVKDDWDGRGLATIDYDNNGRPDFLIGNVGKRSLFYVNQPKHDNAWIGFHLEGRKNNRDAVGARIMLRHQRADKSEQTQYWEVNAGNGYASQADPRLLFGLGPENVRLLEAKVIWPGLKEQPLDIRKLKLRSYNRVIESN
jgi:hypothetical protein